MIEKRVLGKTGIEASRLCFGALTLGPLQAKLPLEQGAQILAHAIERGINFVDTAQLYETYPYILRAIELSGKRDLIVCSKTYAYDRSGAEKAVDEARRALDRDYIDIFMLHEQESEHTLRGHREALEYLFECKQRGTIRAVGASMHHVAAVRGATALGLDVIHPLLNLTGLGIVDGDRAAMEEAVREAHRAGIGVYLMKALGGGNLFRRAEECLRWAFALDCADSVAIGMQSIEEVDADIGFLQTGGFDQAQKKSLAEKTRRLHIDSWCERCGNCVSICKQKALSLSSAGAVCDHRRCLLCGYCSAGCPAWAIKVV